MHIHKYLYIYLIPHGISKSSGSDSWTHGTLVDQIMADTSASESDSSSIDGNPLMMPPSPITREQLQKRIESLQQQNRVFKVEIETYKLRIKALQEENRNLRQASVNIVNNRYTLIN